jgi:hypothetical protein
MVLLTSMMIAKGAHIATDQQIPIKLMKIVAFKSPVSV